MATVRIADNVFDELKSFLEPESKYVDVNYTKFVSDAVKEKIKNDKLSQIAKVADRKRVGK